ncbi:MAG: Protein phosphatase 1 regulatory subunit sds22 [Bogoriella megaspora]|nr:MAG: Protein phosphatase 1 regulatory subunit sds22 [Bogoriella megaspora]
MDSSPGITNGTLKNGNDSPTTSEGGGPRNRSGWDGKLRVEKKPILVNPEALSDPEYSDEDAPPPVQIDADEDLLDDVEQDAEDVDLTHCRVVSIPALRLDRFQKLKQVCLRQNQISKIKFPDSLAATLENLDLYDNLISHVNGLDQLTGLTTLDLSFNKIKHIKNLDHLKKLKDLYFVQNKIQTIENLEGLSVLRNLELGANRIREIQNLDTLTSLEELWLGKNKITELKNLDTLTNLKILSIQSNRLTSLSGLPHIPNLTDLHISHNAISSLAPLAEPPTTTVAQTNGSSTVTNGSTAPLDAPSVPTPSLRVLDISSNPIKSLHGLQRLKHLEELWASYCQMSSFDEVEKVLADKEELETVYFEGTPLMTQQPALYRNKVKLALPRIKQIDATFVRT